MVEQDSGVSVSGAGPGGLHTWPTPADPAILGLGPEAALGAGPAPAWGRRG